jgi:TRAP-type mannitol/chloroaromatic compound transport system permease small subunit
MLRRAAAVKRIEEILMAAIKSAPSQQLGDDFRKIAAYFATPSRRRTRRKAREASGMASMETLGGARPLSGVDAALAAVVAVGEGVNRVVGSVVALMTLGTVLACFASVYTRYALGVNFIWLQEAYVWQHAAVIMLGAGYTMMTGGFIRVDVFYATWSARRRAAMDLVMTALMLAPFLYVFTFTSWRFFLNSWLTDEGSQNPGGLGDLWLLKGALLGLCVLVGLQGLVLVARSILVLRGREEFADTAVAPAN